MSCLFRGCFGLTTSVIENNIQTCLKEPLTNASIVCVVDELGEGVLEKVVQPGICCIVGSVTGMDISGVLTNVIETTVEPAVDGLLNPAVSDGLTLVENSVSPVVEPILDTVNNEAMPLLNGADMIIEGTKSVVSNTESLLESK